MNRKYLDWRRGEQDRLLDVIPFNELSSLLGDFNAR
jgi:hypothetical protein